MKRRLFVSAWVLTAWLAFGTLRGWAQSGAPAASGGAPPSNPLKVALLKWYKADLAAQFLVGSQPYGVAFDGANIWTANLGSNTVTKLRACDGAVLGTFNVGSQAVGVTFDGANVCVSNSGNGTVTKLRASDGTVLGTF